MLTGGASIQYISMVVPGEALSKIDTLSIEVRSTTLEHLKLAFWGFGMYVFTVIVLSKQTRVVHRRISKPYELKVMGLMDATIWRQKRSRVETETCPYH